MINGSKRPLTTPEKDNVQCFGEILQVSLVCINPLWWFESFTQEVEQCSIAMARYVNRGWKERAKRKSFIPTMPLRLHTWLLIKYVQFLFSHVIIFTYLAYLLSEIFHYVDIPWQQAPLKSMGDSWDFIINISNLYRKLCNACLITL